MREREAVAVAAGLPDVPQGTIVSVAWSIEGLGRVIGGLLPAGHPDGGALGRRILRGDTLWAAQLQPWDQEITSETALIEPGPPERPSRVIVHGPDGDIAGYLDQPWLPTGRFRRLTQGLRRDARRVRVRAGGRVWWIRATNVFGVRVVRDDGAPVYTTRGLHAEFADEADTLDMSVVLLALASIPSSSYAPILGF